MMFKWLSGIFEMTILKPMSKTISKSFWIAAQMARTCFSA